MIKKYYIYVAFAVALFLPTVTLLRQAAPLHVREDFEFKEGALVKDANNVGPRFREFEVDAMPGTTIYLDDVLLGNKGAAFADAMDAGVKVRFAVLKSELAAAATDPGTHVHAYSLEAGGTTFVDFEDMLADQEGARSRGRFSGFMLGGLGVAVGLILLLLYRRQQRRAA